MKLTLEQIAGATHGTGSFSPSAVATGYSIDSRTLLLGELFFAVRGEHLDGHNYVEAALAKGAVAAVISHTEAARFPQHSARLILVADPFTALQTLAAFVRSQWKGILIGVTGSAGKTTTKEAIAQVLAAKFNVLKSLGNLNNAFGMPLQLLKLEPEHQFAVIEMGMSFAGEIASLATIAGPQWGVVSNVAPVHIENFADGIIGVARAKAELVAALPPDGIAFLNADDPHVSKFGENFSGKSVFFGLSATADVRAEAIRDLGVEGVAFDVVAESARLPGHLKLVGRHNILNALAAVAVGLAAAVPVEECVAALAKLEASDKRGQLLYLRGATLINDCYNSNPRALDAMVDALITLPATRRIVIAGEMLELGPESASLHRGSGQQMAARHIDLVLGVRGNAREIVAAVHAAGSQAKFLETPEEAGQWLQENLAAGDAVLLKASRGVRLERALEALSAELQPDRT